MDPAWFEDLKGRLMGLLIALEDRLDESDARQVMGRAAWWWPSRC
jgi:hypothetical protein